MRTLHFCWPSFHFSYQLDNETLLHHERIVFSLTFVNLLHILNKILFFGECVKTTLTLKLKCNITIFNV